MTARFDGLRALVLGGGADGPARDGDAVAMGNGRAICQRISSEGGVVAVADLSLERAGQTVESLDGKGVALAVDAADPEQCRETVRRAAAEMGGLDMVVCNVGIGGASSIRRQSVEQWDSAMDINARSHWVTASEALGPMLDAGRGAFVFVSSVAATSTNGFALSYEASKAAQSAISRHIAVRYGARGIRSNVAVLGLIDSAMARREQGTGYISRLRASLPPAGRQGRPEEVAAAVAFLLSDDASYVNGTELIIDGALSVRAPDSLVRGTGAPFELRPTPEAEAAV